jgi:hypothetical protein
MPDFDRTASILSPAKLAQVKPVAAVSPVAWLDQPPAEAGRQPLLRLHDLQAELAASIPCGDDRELAAALEQLAQAIAQVDFSLLRAHGWLARALGRDHSAGVQFSGRYEQAAEAVAALAQRLKALQGKALAQASAADRRLVELEVECVALDQSIAQGTAWVQDMRSRSQPRAAEDVARCNALADRLGLLAAVAGASRQARAHGQALQERRATVRLAVHQAMAGPVKAWRVRMSVLANTAQDALPAQPELEAPAQAQRAVEALLRQLAADCSALHALEAALAASLSALQIPLGAAR